MMDVFIGTFILIAISFILICIFHSNNEEESSIPYVKHGNYPIVGHLFSFLRDRTKFVMDCQKQYGQCFKIRLFDQRFTFILSSVDWISISRNQSLHFPGLEHGVQIFDFPMSIFDHPEFDEELHRQYIKYLKNRDGLRPMTIEFARRIRELMQREKATLKNTGNSSEWIQKGLLEFGHYMIYEPSTLALFGEINPISIENDYRIFDDKFHYFISGLPCWMYSWFFSKELKARSRLINACSKNLNLLRESEFMQARKALFQENSDWVLEKDQGAFQTAIFWASLGNTIPTVFWCLFYILQDKKAVEKIQEEINKYLPYFSLDNEIDDSILEQWSPEQLNLCIYLESAINEMLRLSAAPMLIKKCRQETHIVLEDGRTLNVKPNETVAYFPAATHLDENKFPEPNKFIFDRFINQNSEHISGFVPFGTGKSMCPGRFFAKNEIKICVAMILRYIEYKFIDTNIIPKQRPERVGFGVAPPTQDIQIKYRYKT